MPEPKANIPLSDFQQLQSLFLSLTKPYGPADIVRFNLAYYRAYPRLKPDERRRSEDWADVLVAGMGKDDEVGGRGDC